MGKSRFSFLPKLLNLALFCASIFSVRAEARSCSVRLKQSLVVTRDSTVAKHTSTLDHGDLVDELRKSRSEAKDSPDLKVTKGAKVRTPEQIEAWLTHISNRLKEAKADPASKMPMEEFFGMIDGGFGREGARFENIFKDYGIKHVRLVSSKNFKSKIVKDGKGAEAKDSIYIEVPDFPVDQPEKAALWIKDLYLTLHDASTNMVANKVNKSAKVVEAAAGSWIGKRVVGVVENVTGQHAKHIWVEQYRKDIRNLDRGVRNVLIELDAYLKTKFPEEENPLGLSKRSLSPGWWHHGISLFKATDSVVGGELASKGGTLAGQAVDSGMGTASGEGWGGFGGGLVGTAFGVFTKVRFPLESWKPSQKWLLSKESFEIERNRLESRLTMYRYYKGTSTLADLYAKGSFLLGTISMGYYYTQNRSLTGGAEDGLEKEKDKAAKELDVLTQEQLSKLNVEQVQDTYNKLLKEEAELQRQLAEAIKSKNISKADTLNSRLLAKAEYMKRVLGQLEALNPDGLEYER